MNKSILLVGVGGQGTILVSKILTQGLLEKGYDVKMSEIHGMAQRGGSVTTQIRFGDVVESPSIDPRGADTLIAFEKLEALRYVDFLKPGGSLVINDTEIYPMPVLTGYEEYPDRILENLTRSIEDVTVINAEELAMRTGNARTQNIVLLGVLVGVMELGEIDWKSIIRKNLAQKFHDMNCLAFDIGYELGKNMNRNRR